MATEISGHPTSYDSSYSAYSVSGLAQGETDSSSTNYATINLTRGSSAETSIYYNFSLNIPTGATINSVTCTAKCYISTTNSGRIATREVRLYSGTTAKGSSATVSNSTTAFSVTTGDWTADELNNAKIRIHAVRGTSNTNTNYYFRFYGATLTVTYTTPPPQYSVSLTNTSSVTAAVSDTSPTEGDDVLVTVSTISGIAVTDNNVDITSQFVNAGGTFERVAKSETHTGISSGAEYATYPIGKPYDDPYVSTYNMRAASGSTGYVDYVFDFGFIPPDAVITGTFFTAYGHAQSPTYTSGTSMAELRLYSGNTAKGSASHFSNTSNKILMMGNTGTWTRAELQDAIARFTVAASGGLVCGMTWEVTYTSNGSMYTITNISGNHTIVITQTTIPLPLRVKQNGSWVTPTKILVKQNGTWKQATKILAKNNGTWK